MGVDRRDYIMHGWKMPYDVKDSGGELIQMYDSEKHLPYIEGHKGVEYAIVKDDMGGRYCFFGKVVATADDCDGWDEIIDLEKLRLDLQDSETDLELKYRDLFDQHGEIESPTTFIFTNYS